MRHDWRDTLRTATDLAVLGFAMTAAALPLVTAGAAVATGSAAVRHHLDTDSWPPARELWTVFRRTLLPGLAATALLLVVAALVLLDVAALRAGAVPGGLPLTVLLIVPGLLAVGFAGLLAVTTDLRAARALATPARLLAAGGVVALTVLLALLVHPVLTPLLAGYGLFALHVITRRSGRPAMIGR
ncbi:DUF624 domain-containing protein [Actinoplanes sp. N902-109]|uniref:DUF624 domain-containing protein n=1 Tax=Actinoplanes sp. (strain N902-109) TaxID=649831 RepID=UPI00032947E2|nr:DUF624 domain-containing protein [Actinoplanes sp. N902-109]AGL17303.1 hypothetical protein L083_3793 [Actinoplanes sp. N902-109]